MLRTVEATIDEIGVLRMLEPVKLPKLRRAIVMILDEEPAEDTLNRANRNQEIALWKSNTRRDMRGFLQIRVRKKISSLTFHEMDVIARVFVPKQSPLCRKIYGNRRLLLEDSQRHEGS